jgi:hypothetical protein
MFGTSLSGTDLSGQTSTFAVGSTLSWRVGPLRLCEDRPADARLLAEGRPGALQQIGTQPIPVQDQSSNLFTGTMDLSVTGVSAGTYVVSLARDTTTLATRTFQVQ